MRPRRLFEEGEKQDRDVESDPEVTLQCDDSKSNEVPQDHAEAALSGKRRSSVDREGRQLGPEDKTSISKRLKRTARTKESPAH